jgi:hypothetical protein
LSLSDVSDGLNLLSETAFEAGRNNSFGVDVERLLFTYAFGDLLLAPQNSPRISETIFGAHAVYVGVTFEWLKRPCAFAVGSRYDLSEFVALKLHCDYNALRRDQAIPRCPSRPVSRSKGVQRCLA